jgi:xylulokinase
MNLLDIQSETERGAAEKEGGAVSYGWDPTAVAAAGITPSQLGPAPVPSTTLVLPNLVVGTGDNPSSLVSLSLSLPGTVGVSLGTSDVVMTTMAARDAKPGKGLHLFVSPSRVDERGALLCFSNGALVRREVAEAVVGGDWGLFDEAFFATEPQCGHPRDTARFYWRTPELLPSGAQQWPGGKLTKEDIVHLVRSQCLARLVYTREVGLKKATRLVVTGGGAGSAALCQCLADCFGVPAYRQSSTDAAAVGATVRVVHAALAPDEELSSLAARLLPPPSLVATPRPAYALTDADIATVRHRLEGFARRG